MSNSIIYNKYSRFFLYQDNLIANSDSNTDFSVHFSFDGKINDKTINNYLVGEIKNNNGFFRIKLIYNIDDIVNYFQIVYYMITKCNLTFNTQFDYPKKKGIAKAVKKGIFALEAIKKLTDYKKYVM